MEVVRSTLRRLCAAALAAAALASGTACGEDLFRPIAVEIDGLSARAEKLVVKLFPRSTGQLCANISLTSAPVLRAPIEREWRRSTSDPRKIELPAVPEESVTIVAYSEDVDGEPLQYGCKELTFKEIGDLDFGTVKLALSKRM